MKRATFTSGAAASGVMLAGLPTTALGAQRRIPHAFPIPGAYRPPAKRKVRHVQGLPAAAPPVQDVIAVTKTFGPPIFFVWDPATGNVTTALTQDSTKISNQLGAMLDASVSTAYVSVSIPYINASSYFVSPPDGSKPRQKEIVQFKPTITQLQELPELKDPLSWSDVMMFDTSLRPNLLMYSGKFQPSQPTALRGMPLQNGLGQIALPYAGTALNDGSHTLLGKIDAALKKINAVVNIANGIPGLVINAATTVAFSTAQNTVDQLVKVFAGNPQNEEAFDSSGQTFAITKVAAASDPTYIRVPSAGQWYIVVPGGDPPNTPAQSDAFAADISRVKVQQLSSGKLSAKDPKSGAEDDSFFDKYNYIVVHMQVFSSKP